MAGRNSLFVLILGIVVIRLLAAAWVPILPDEAYYMQWARFLDWGYLDHPPGVALIAQTAVWSGFSSAFLARLGTVILSLSVIPITLALMQTVGFNSIQQKIFGLLFSCFNIGGLMFGFLTTPDVVLIFAWSLALWQTARALQGNNRAWLTTGAAVGVGLLGKYMMVLFYPVLLWTILCGNRKHLKNPWLYAGALVSFLVFSPHVFWNAQNDWISFRFQMRRGFENSHKVALVQATDLPRPEKVNDPQSLEQKYFDYFLDPNLVEAPKRKKSDLQKFFSRVGEFISSQLLLWGFLLIPMAILFRRPNRTKLAISSQLRPLLYAATFVPLIMFGLVSMKTKVETNWPAFYMLSAGVLLAGIYPARWKLLAGASVANVCVLIFSILHAQGMSAGLSAKSLRKDRILKETHGYEELAALLKEAPRPLFVQSYQLKAMLDFYNQDTAVAQWPGLTRVSEFTRASHWYELGLADLETSGQFWILTSNPLAERIEGFQLREMKEIRDCLGEGLKVWKADFDKLYESQCPEQVLRRWFLVGYRKS